MVELHHQGTPQEAQVLHPQGSEPQKPRVDMEASLLLQFPAVAFVLGLRTPSPDPHTQSPDSCFTPCLAGLGLSSRTVIMKSGEVWSFPAVGAKVGQGRPCLALVGKVACISNYCGFGLGQWAGCILCLGCAAIKASSSAQRCASPPRGVGGQLILWMAFSDLFAEVN